MVINKGLYLDGNEVEQPAGTWRDAQNASFDKSKSAIGTELGTKLYADLLPANERVYGVVEDNDHIFLFTADPAAPDFGCIRVIDPSAKNEIVMQFSNAYRLDDSYGIKGKVAKNAQNERILVWTDGLQPLSFVNVDEELNRNSTATYSATRNSVMAPDTTSSVSSDPRVETRVEFGGFFSIIDASEIPSGAYIPFFYFINRNNVRTNYIIGGNPQMINDDIGGNIVFEFFDLPFNDHEKLGIGIIRSDQDVVTATILEEVVMTSSSYVYNLTRITGTDIDILEVLTPKRNYNNVSDIELIDDRLALAGCNEDFPFDYQKYANNILINYNLIRETGDPAAAPNRVNEFTSRHNVAEGHSKSFMPGEVYAFYIVFEMNDGSLSPAYHIPGRAPIAADGVGLGGGVIGYDLWQTNDTTAQVGAATNMGFFQNQDELYPDNPNYDSSGVAGLDLRGLNVRHHVFPTIHAMRLRGELDSTLKSVPIFGIDVSNVELPERVQNCTKSWRIVYAQRTVPNMRVLAMDYAFAEGTRDDGNEDGKYYAQPFNIKYNGDGMDGDADTIGLALDALRFHALDLQINQPIINPVYIRGEFNVSATLDDRDGRTVLTEDNRPLVFEPELSNSWLAGISAVTKTARITRAAIDVRGGFGDDATDSGTVKVVTDYEYVPANSINSKFDNRMGEQYLHLKLDSDVDHITNTELVVDGAIFRSTLYSLCQVPLNVYANFFEQTTLVLTDAKGDTGSALESRSGIRGGDVLHNPHEYITSGPFHRQNFGDDSNIFNEADAYVGLNTIVSFRGTVLSVSDGRLRDYQINNPQTFFHSAVGISNAGLFDRYNPSQPYEYDYNPSFSIQSEINTALPFNPNSEIVNLFSERIHLSQPFSRTDAQATFDFARDDFYTMPRDRGRLIGINEYGGRLVIRHERSLYITVIKQKIATNTSEALIGANDIFDVAPDEIVTADKGFAGSQSRFTSIVTEWGVSIVDTLQGKIFLLTQNLEDISKLGLKNYMEERLPFASPWATRAVSAVTFNASEDRYEISITGFYKRELYRYRVGDYIYNVTNDVFNQVVGVEILSDNSGDTTLAIKVDTSSTPVTGNILHYFKPDNPYRRSGVVVGYDKRNERFLFTKNDTISVADELLECVKGLKGGFVVDNDVVLANGQIQQFNGATYDVLTPVDQSWTLSYYPENRYKFWGSFHDYRPNAYVTLANRFISIENSGAQSRLWEHNILKAIGEFYGVAYVFEIEIVNNEGGSTPKRYLNNNWNTEVFDASLVRQPDVTFTNIQFINSYQQSLDFALVVFTDINTPYNIRQEGYMWRYNFIRNNSDNKLMTDRFLRIKIRNDAANLLYLYTMDFKFNLINPLR